MPVASVVDAALQDQTAGRRVEDVQPDAEVRVLVEGGELLRARAAGEVPDGEPGARRVELPGARVVDALDPAKCEG